MNDLIRPALYQAWMNVIAVQPHEGDTRRYDIVGPICETGDFPQGSRAGTGRRRPVGGVFGRRLRLRHELQLQHPRPRAEVLVDGDQAFEVRRRESVQELYAGESLLPT